ncbi:hypothetical protein [Brevibacterium casei]|uniref:hypothetical protein n=1 Tax=Brevibacterium casei TaxID=33889 RepID=UPI0013C2B6AE|nr:hypothetical protein [Brevibacterium casei]
MHTITDCGREDTALFTATSRRAAAEARREELEGEGARLSTAQRVAPEFVRHVNNGVTVCAKHGDLSPETVRRLEAELNREHEAIARRSDRP